MQSLGGSATGRGWSKTKDGGSDVDSHSRQSLKVDQICHSMEVETESIDINASNVPSIRTVLDFCRVVQLLLELEDVKPDRPDNRRETTLSLGPRYSWKEVLMLFKPRKAVTPRAV